jgi:hypothetical protein
MNADEAYHALMAQELARQARESHKNRHLVSAKLTAPTYAALVSYCKERNLSINSGLRALLQDYFHITPTTPNA